MWQNALLGKITKNGYRKGAYKAPFFCLKRVFVGFSRKFAWQKRGKEKNLKYYFKKRKKFS